MTAFQAALEAGDLDSLRRVPKSDLHNHFFLGGNRALVSKWAGTDIAPLDRKLTSMAEMHEWVQARFGALSAGAQGRLRAFEATLVQAKLDGVTRLDTGETAWAITLHDHSAVALTEALKSVHARVAPDVDWIPQLDLAREAPVPVQARRLAPFLELGFYRTLDMSGDERRDDGVRYWLLCANLDREGIVCCCVSPPDGNAAGRYRLHRHRPVA